MHIVGTSLLLPCSPTQTVGRGWSHKFYKPRPTCMTRAVPQSTYGGQLAGAEGQRLPQPLVLLTTRMGLCTLPHAAAVLTWVYAGWHLTVSCRSCMLDGCCPDGTICQLWGAHVSIMCILSKQCCVHWQVATHWDLGSIHLPLTSGNPLVLNGQPSLTIFCSRVGTWIAWARSLDTCLAVFWVFGLWYCFYPTYRLATFLSYTIQ